MIEELQAYAEYKPSGIAWLDTVPAHWELTRFNAISHIKSSSGRPDLPLLSVYLNRGVIPFSDVDEKRTNATAESLDAYQVVEHGDLVLNNQQAWRGSVGVAFHQGIISPAYIILGLRSDIDRHFANLLFRSPDMVANFVVCSKGVGTIQRNLIWPLLKDAKVWLPPPDEQAAIVRFLAALDRRVNRFVRAKRRLIELLTEQKQAIITHAVRGGLNPNATLKPSGLPWVGDIPDDWSRFKMNRACLSIRDGTHNPPLEVPGVHRLLSVRNIIDSKFCLRHDDRTMTPEAFTALERSYTVREGDVVLALVGATTGKSAVVGPVQDVSVQRSLGILRPRLTAASGDYLQLVIQSHIVQHQIKEVMDKYAAQPGIYLNDLNALQIVLPPLPIQDVLLRHVRESSGELNAAIANARREIELLREYRTRLVADVVTGKLDVRAAAAHLPDEDAEPVASIADDVSAVEADADDEGTVAQVLEEVEA